jgi:hypothetical protein
VLERRVGRDEAGHVIASPCCGRHRAASPGTGGAVQPTSARGFAVAGDPPCRPVTARLFASWRGPCPAERRRS